MPIRRSPNGARHPRPQRGRDRPEWVVAINRNGWSQSIVLVAIIRCAHLGNGLRAPSSDGGRNHMAKSTKRMRALRKGERRGVRNVRVRRYGGRNVPYARAAE
jgi:hypothetical protein